MHNVHKLYKKQPKMRFLAIFLGLTERFDSIPHILLVLNGPHDLVVVLPYYTKLRWDSFKMRFIKMDLSKNFLT